MSGQAIYENFARSNLGMLAGSSDLTVEIARNYQDRAVALDRLASVMTRVWQGEAADAAQFGIGPLVTGNATAGSQIGNAAVSIQHQAEAFEVARNSVVPVPPVPEKPGFFDNLVTFGDASGDYEQQLASAQAANDNNIAVMLQYEDTTRQNQAMLSEIPQALNPIADGGQTVPPSSAPPPQYPTPYRIPAAGSSGQSGSGGSSPGAANTTSNQQPNVHPPASRAPDTEPRQTHANAVHPPTPHVSVETGSLKSALLPEGPKPGLSLGPVGGGFRPGGGVPGAGGHGSGNPGEAGARAGSRGGIGARMPAGLDGAAGKGAVGRGPGSGVPLGSGTRSQEAEDLEHRRPSFLVETDPDELFGSDEAAAPPVIGA